MAREFEAQKINARAACEIVDKYSFFRHRIGFEVLMKMASNKISAPFNLTLNIHHLNAFVHSYVFSRWMSNEKLRENFKFCSIKYLFKN